MEELLTMTSREIDRLRVIRQLLEHKLRWREAAEQLGLSERQIARPLSANMYETLVLWSLE